MQEISRIAFLFGAPGGSANGTNYLNGVAPDLQNVKDFLLSSNGGAWRKDEIIVRNDITYFTAMQLIKNNRADYCFIYFSGHGGCDNSGNRYLCLQDGTVKADNLFASGSIWQLGIADSCGNYFGASIGALDQEEWLSFDGVSEARRKFDEAILNSIPGSQTIFPTQPGYSTADSLGGGNFTLAVLKSAKKIRSMHYSAVTIQMILGDIPKHDLDYNVPVIYCTSTLSLPFAVSIPPNDRARKIPNQIQPPQASVNWGGLALLTLGVFAIGSILDSRE